MKRDGVALLLCSTQVKNNHIPQKINAIYHSRFFIIYFVHTGHQTHQYFDTKTHQSALPQEISVSYSLPNKSKIAYFTLPIRDVPESKYSVWKGNVMLASG